MAESSSQSGRSVTRLEFEQDVIQRARQDQAFRQQLLASPAAALKATYDVDLPPGVELEVLEETTSRFYMVLPVDVEELSDEQLAAAAGGVGTGAVTPQAAPGALLWNPTATMRVK